MEMFEARIAFQSTNILNSYILAPPLMHHRTRRTRNEASRDLGTTNLSRTVVVAHSSHTHRGVGEVVVRMGLVGNYDICRVGGGGGIVHGWRHGRGGRHWCWCRWGRREEERREVWKGWTKKGIDGESI